MIRGLNTVDHVLRRQSTKRAGLSELESHHASVLPLRNVAIIVLVFGPIYGTAMGAYALVTGHRGFSEQLPQMLYSGIKVPILLAITIAIALPSFFVINTLMGLRDDFRESLRSIISAQAGLTIILASLFPITLFFYSSLTPEPTSYPMAILFNAAMFGIASVSAQFLLIGYFQKLIEKNIRHLWMCRLWIVLYGFVGIQVGYVLRPFIGSPSIEPTFLRKESFQNAYVKVFSLICDVIQGIFG